MCITYIVLDYFINTAEIDELAKWADIPPFISFRGGCFMEINKERMIREFAALVAIDSPSFGEKQMGEYIKQHLVSLGFHVSEDNAGTLLNGNCGNIYGFLEGSIQDEPLLFCAHMDTVEPSGGKQAIVGENGVITGNGDTVLGADDCAGMAAILEALYTIKDHQLQHRPIEVLFTVAEEHYCMGAELFDFSRIKAKQAYVLDLAGPVGTLAYKAPSILSFTVTVSGKSAHAGFAPEDGVHAIAAAAKAISRLDMGRIEDDTTLNIGVIHGGLSANIVPDRCVVSGEIRSYTHIKALERADIVKEIFQAEADAIGAAADMQLCCTCEAYEADLNHQVVKRFIAACEIKKLSTALQRTFGGSDNNHLAKHGITGVVVANAMNQCHSCDEYTSIGELHCIAELTLSLMTSTI